LEVKVEGKDGKDKKAKVSSKIISMFMWIQTSRLSMKKSLSAWA